MKIRPKPKFIQFNKPPSKPGTFSSGELWRPVKKMAGDTFEFSCSLRNLDCKKLNDLTLEKYRNLSFLNKLKFNILTPVNVRCDAGANFYAACRAQKYLDNFYGKENYTAIIIGRSMATIGETMRLMGRDVRILPMSGLADGMPQNIQNVDVYRRFLESVGLTKEIIEQNPKHKYLLLDYVSSGETLKNAHKFLSRPDLLGNPGRLETISSQTVLGCDGLMSSCLDLLFLFQRLKKYSPVQKLNFSELGKVFERLEPDASFETKQRLFMFNTMKFVDRYMKKTGK